jgi:hypothetical protein
MASWQGYDFAITKVRFIKGHSHEVESLLVRRITGAGPDAKPAAAEEPVGKQAVIEAITPPASKRYITAPPVTGGIGVEPGTPVRVVNVGGTQYLKSGADSGPRDRLNRLPRF